VSTVLAIQSGPNGGAAGAVALPATGQGHRGDEPRYLFAILGLLVSGAGLVSAAMYRQQRR